MELRHLTSLLAVVDGGTYRAAAESLHLSEPAVWKQVAALQTELGVEVLQRSGRQARLTSNGRLVVGAARTVVAAADALRELADDLALGSEGRVRVACVRPHVVACLAGAVGAMAETHPRVRVELVDYAELDVPPAVALERGLVDLATVTPLPAGCDGHVAYRVTVGVIDGRARRRAAARVEIADLAGRSLLASPRGFYSRDRLDDALRSIGSAAQVAFESPHSDVLAAMTAAGLGVAVVADDTLPPGSAVTPVERDGEPLADDIWLAWRHDLSPAAEAFVAAVRR